MRLLLLLEGGGASVTHRDPALGVGELGLLECYGQAFGVVHLVCGQSSGLGSWGRSVCLSARLGESDGRAERSSLVDRQVDDGWLAARQRKPLQPTPPAPVFIITALIRTSHEKTCYVCHWNCFVLFFASSLLCFVLIFGGQEEDHVDN